MTDLRITQAQREDMPDVRAILCEAAAWLASSGKAMWQEADFAETRIAPAVDAGEYWLAYQGDQAIGLLRFQLHDPWFWPEITDDSSAFVHRLAVRRLAAGTGVSVALLDFARTRAIALGKTFLRLDCVADRAHLRRFYETYGFRFHSLFRLEQWQLARYELCLEPA